MNVRDHQGLSSLRADRAQSLNRLSRVKTNGRCKIKQLDHVDAPLTAFNIRNEGLVTAEHMASISPPARAFLSVNASGAQATMPKINQTTLVSLPIPLPPLAEQHRIVAKVDELMALCGRLARISHTALA
jgi:hypothetical protein